LPELQTLPAGRTGERTLVRRRLRSTADVLEIERRCRPEELRPADTVLGCLRFVAGQHPDKVAIRQLEAPDLLDPAVEVTYRRLVREIERAANLVHDLAGDAPSAVGVMLPMLPEGLPALWGAQTAGVGVPINPFLELPALARILVDARATVLVTTREVMAGKGGAQAVHDLVPTLRRVLYVRDPEPGSAHDYASALAAYDDEGLRFRPDEDPQRDAMLMPTGGTTGVPKLVRMSQGSQLTVGWNVGGLMGNEEDLVTAHGMPNFHCGGTLSLGLRTLMAGGTLLTLTDAGFRSPEVVARFWDIARHHRVTSVLATPTTALALLNQDEGSSDGCVLSDFHVGGSAVPMGLVERFHDRFGIWLRENWGMTELHGTTTGHVNDGALPRAGSAGRPLPFVRVKAVHLEPGNRYAGDCAPRERGTLLVGTPTVTAGYLNEDLNGELFPTGMPDDLPPGWRWANTGDIGSVDEDGYVWVFGRAKDVIIRGGHNIDPQEIEDVLLQHPAVRFAAAVGRPDRSKGELPVAHVELKPGVSVTADDLLAHCREHVQEKAAAPVEVILTEQVPLTPVGKIAKPVLRADALTRTVRAVLAEVGTEGTVELDSSGPRQRVVVTVADSHTGQDVRAALSGFEFVSEVRTAGGPEGSAR